MAQIGLSYTYNNLSDDIDDDVNTLAIIAQVCIDNAKKSFDINPHEEIRRVKDKLNIKSIGYPAFFAGIRPDLRSKVNPNIQCPMNCVYKIRNKSIKDKNVVDNAEFFIPHPNLLTTRKSKQVEKLIEDYSLEVFRMHVADDVTSSDYFLLRTDYEDLLDALRRITLSKNYLGLMSWLINRALMITPGIQKQKESVNTKLSKNRPLLLKILYDMNPKTFKKCFKSDRLECNN